jgi:hypothetical protein
LNDNCERHPGDRLFDLNPHAQKRPITNDPGHYLLFQSDTVTFDQLQLEIQKLKGDTDAKTKLAQLLSLFQFSWVPQEEAQTNTKGGVIVEGFANESGSLLTTDVDLLAIAPLTAAVYPHALTSIKRSQSLPTHLPSQQPSSSRPPLVRQFSQTKLDAPKKLGFLSEFELRLIKEANQFFKSMGKDRLGPQFSLEDIVQHGTEIRYQTKAHLENSLEASLPIRVYSPYSEKAQSVSDIAGLKSVYLEILTNGYMICPRPAWNWHLSYEAIAQWCPFVHGDSRKGTSAMYPSLSAYFNECGLELPIQKRGRTRTEKILNSSR